MINIEGCDSPEAMTETICLSIALLGGMMFFIPFLRAFVLQLSPPSTVLPLACLLLLTFVLVPLASTSTSPILSVPLVPLAMSIPLAPCCSTPYDLSNIEQKCRRDYVKLMRRYSKANPGKTLQVSVRVIREAMGEPDPYAAAAKPGGKVVFTSDGGEATPCSSVFSLSLSLTFYYSVNTRALWLEHAPLRLPHKRRKHLPCSDVALSVSVRCVCSLPVGRATLRLLVRSNGGSLR